MRDAGVYTRAHLSNHNYEICTKLVRDCLFIALGVPTNRLGVSKPQEKKYVVHNDIPPD